MRTFVLLNPAAGHSEPQVIRRLLDEKLPQPQWQVEIRETTPEDDVAQLARAAIEDGAELICAAGGDGTVSQVVDALVGTKAQLGIIPAGTTNALAQALEIPREIEGAVEIIANSGRRMRLDAIELDGHYYVLGVGVGLSAATMEKTKSEDKRRFGEAAYVWTVLKELAGWQPRRYTLQIDGKQKTVTAADILLANAGVLTGSLKWGEHIQPDDGRIDLCVVRARSAVNYAGLLLDVLRRRQRSNRHIQFFSVTESVKISAGSPTPVTGDGEIIGNTPIEARVVKSVVTVLVP